MRAWLALLALLAAAPVARAAPDTTGIQFEPHLGARLPLETVLRDESGAPVTLGDAAVHLPLVLALGYYKCSALCGIVREDTLSGLERAGLRPGVDYRLVLLSVDPAETQADAAGAKQGALDRYPGAADARFLTASEDAIETVSQAAGFSFRFDPALKQFLHPAGLVIATADGKISTALAGIGYDPAALRSGVLRAGQGRIAAALSPVLLLCFHFDPASGNYELSVFRALSVMAGLTVVTLATTLALLHRGRRA